MSHARPFKLTYMFHPSVHVLDLDETEAWYQRVFGCSSMRMAYGPPPDPDNRMDYSTFTMIRDVLMDSIDPKRFVKQGKQQYADIDQPHLKGFGWYVEGLSELWRSLRRHDIEVVGLLGVEGTDDEPPMALQSSTAMFFATPDAVGLRYQFLGPMPMPWDPRMTEGWQLDRPSADDPLGIEYTSHHTVLTDQPERISRLLIDALGGELIHTDRNEAIGMSSTYVRIADGVIEFGSPDNSTPTAHRSGVAAAARRLSRHHLQGERSPPSPSSPRRTGRRAAQRHGRHDRDGPNVEPRNPLRLHGGSPARRRPRLSPPTRPVAQRDVKESDVRTPRMMEEVAVVDGFVMVVANQRRRSRTTRSCRSSVQHRGGDGLGVGTIGRHERPATAGGDRRQDE